MSSAAKSAFHHFHRKFRKQLLISSIRAHRPNWHATGIYPGMNTKTDTPSPRATNARTRFCDSIGLTGLIFLGLFYAFSQLLSVVKF